MNEDSAKALLKKTFKNKFDMDNYVEFLKELFNKSNIHPKVYDAIRKEFWSYENKVYILGDYHDDSGDSIAFYVVELTKQSSRDRARTMQRNLIASLIKDKYDSALVAFYEPNLDDWRFSHVKVEYEFNEKGIREKLSSPRRHSFLVGVNEPNHTCQSQFLELLCNEDNIQLNDIEQAFSIENVTDEFFDKYKELYLDLVDSLNDVKKNDSEVNSEFEQKNIKSSDFAKKLMGQIVFIYFLQKKGWLGVKKDAEWGTGPKNFLKQIFNQCITDNKNFFNNILEPLFYEGLSEDVRDNHYSKFGYRVPFLNGGLFEPINDYDWVKTDVVLNNSIFSKILDTFDEFNFTVKEDEPLEKEVAVDPEMLGKVFENLLEVTDRKSKGAFYTPRNIVHYMCQENLISYLNTNSGLSEDDLRKFITKGDLAVNSIIRANEEKQKYNGKQYTRIELPDSIKEHSDELEKLLKKVKVIDPAVGSGAFPVGMMNEIVKARYILRLLHGIDNINMYDLKRETIENSLYGVDLELSATDVTKLRFWLSLIVDEYDLKQIRPLPNLDNQIMCGNSVIDGYDNVKLFDDSLIVRSSQTKLSMTPHERAFEELERKKREYFDISGPHRKEELKQEIKQLKWKFIESYLKDIGRNDLIDEIKEFEFSEAKPFFIWELEFSEIFKGENPGFDIVIGNPPYVSAKVHAKNNAEEREIIREAYNLKGSFDLYVVFLLKGLKIANEKAVYSWIIPNKFLTSEYSKDILDDMVETSLYTSVDVSTFNVFKNASVYPIILLGDMANKKQFKKYNLNNIDDLNKRVFVEIEELSFDFKTFDDFNIKIASGTTGFQAKQIKPLIHDEINKKDGDIPFAVSGSIDPFKIDTTKVRYMKDAYNHPYISFDNEVIADSKWKFWSSEKVVIAGMTKKLESVYSKEPLALGVGCYAIFDYAGFDPLFLVGCINSKFFTYFFNEKFKDKHLAGGYLAINKGNLLELPLVKPSPELETKIKNIVIELMDLNKSYVIADKKDRKKLKEPINSLSHELDLLIYKVFELSEDEINTIEEY